jgi:cytochrome c
MSATREHIAALAANADEREAEAAREREEAMAKAVVADPARGKEVFETVCMTCHRMDERLVGPPLRIVLPKYEGKMEELVAFIRNPVKVNPEYPPMPNPGLPLADIRAVAAYLLQPTNGGGQTEGAD